MLYYKIFNNLNNSTYQLLNIFHYFIAYAKIAPPISIVAKHHIISIYFLLKIKKYNKLIYL